MVFLYPGCGLMFIAGQYAGRIACCPVVGIGCCMACCSCPVCGDPVSGSLLARCIVRCLLRHCPFW